MLVSKEGQELTTKKKDPNMRNRVSFLPHLIMGKGVNQDVPKKGILRPPKEKPHVPGIFVSGKVEGVDVKVLVDTGSTFSLVDNYFLSKMTKVSRVVPKRDRPTIQSAGGRNLKIIGQVLLEFEIEGLLIAHHFWVVDNLIVPCLVGTDFLVHNPLGPFMVDLDSSRLVRKEGTFCTSGKCFCNPTYFSPSLF